MKQKQPAVYIMTNQRNTVLYTGVTSDLSGRIQQHKDKAVKGFTAKYNVGKLVHVESFDLIEEAIAREKQIKAGSRAKKIALIVSENPQQWRDLSRDL